VAVDVPWSLYTPLLDLNYHSFAELLTKEKTPAMISTTELVKRHGSRVKNKHKASLNRLTILINDVAMDKEGITEAAAYTATGPLDYLRRIVRNPAFTELCTHATEHLRSAAINNQERSALQLLLNPRRHVPQSSTNDQTDMTDRDEEPRQATDSLHVRQECTRTQAAKNADHTRQLL